MAEQSANAAIALNAISTIVVENLVKDVHGRFQTITLSRRKPPMLEGIRTFGPSVLEEGPPRRRPSTSPPPGDLELRLSAEDILGDGRCGTIFATIVSHLTDPRDPTHLLHLSRSGLPFLPELVIKVGQPSSLKELYNEASVYEEMEILQGVAIPRCYGLFEADLRPAWSLSSSPESDSGLEDLGISQDDYHATRISILLLERVGGLLPLGQKLVDKSDIWAVFNDLSQLGIVQPDMRYSNLLLAPPAEGSFEGTMCPFHNRVHKYRVIDFDGAAKTDWTLKAHYFEQIGSLGRLLEGMEWGIIREPWEY